ncbi:hypothetical protein PJX95_08190 [Serratia rubidaea]|uniref:Uncharacterized protein n=1 Tax=Serratia rubidaea TaxID=61652 RepID=A0ABS0MIY5_SERRU|nr:hypothetical protein [Serratia rubidaea]MBH1932246.1 hypothetical protein [Serratia rubidaea]MDC6118034.1 hypothetical protein [Serratia rubidaea]
MQTARFVKNAALFVVCFIVAFVLSMHGMPLNAPTLAIVDYAYQTFGHSLAGNYEQGADPVSFTAILVANLVYALILFALIKRIAKTFNKKS